MSEAAMPSYTIRKAVTPPALDGDWDSAAWAQADTLDVAQYRPESSAHRPVTQARLLYDADGVFVMFRVHDRFVRCVATDYQGAVYQDACVEFFVQPKPDKGYFNFEMNCGGALLLRNVTDPTRDSGELAEFENVPWELASRIAVYHSMPKTVEPEMDDPVTWVVEYKIPFAVLEAYVGPLGDVAGQEWRANFYKCAESNSHPHFVTWAPIDGPLNFHRPDCFAPIRFEA
ncbi:MAG: diguanylate cyclase [bacterium]|nr:diguanylate cyclase [bacterium]